MHPDPTRSNGRPSGIPASEQGYIMMIAIFLLAVLVLSLAVAAPQVAKSIQRDRDLETFHRGMQYRRAVQLYYRTFHAYPPSPDALVQTNNIRFLRKRYIDPITGKDDWKPIMFGQNKTPTAMGFFGEPLAGSASSIAGTGPSGGNTTTGTSGSAFGGSSFGGSPFGGGSSSGIFGNSGDFGSGQSSSSGTTGSTDSSGGTSGTPGSSSTGSSSSATGSNSSGQTFGGAGIIGFEPASPRQSILVYKKKNHYNEWEFTYDPLSDVKAIGGSNIGTIGQPASSTSTPVGSTPNPATPSMPSQGSSP